MMLLSTYYALIHGNLELGIIVASLWKMLWLFVCQKSLKATKVSNPKQPSPV